MLSKLFNKIAVLTKKAQLIIACSCFFCICCICFCGGMLNSQTVIEQKSSEMISFIKENSLTGYASIQVSPNSESARKKMPNTYNEYFYWKYIFRESNFSFLSTANGGKTHNCFFEEIDNNNVSFICCGNNANQALDDGYFKHEVYDIHLMFKGINIISKNAINFCAISQTMANHLLSNRGALKIGDEYSVEQYELLLGTDTSVLVDGVPCLFSISNIYFEEGDFYTDVSNNFGTFVISYIYFPDALKVESTFIFNSFLYQNMHKIKRIKALFSKGEYSYQVSRYNLNKETDSFDLSWIDKTNGNDVLSITITVFDLFLALFAFIFYWAADKIHNIKFYLPVLFSFLAPYVVLSVVNIFYNVPLIFSYYSLFLYILIFVGFIGLSIAVLLKERSDEIRGKL